MAGSRSRITAIYSFTYLISPIPMPPVKQLPYNKKERLHLRKRRRHSWFHSYFENLCGLPLTHNVRDPYPANIRSPDQLPDALHLPSKPGMLSASDNPSLMPDMPETRHRLLFLSQPFLLYQDLFHHMKKQPICQGFPDCPDVFHNISVREAFAPDFLFPDSCPLSGTVLPESPAGAAWPRWPFRTRDHRAPYRPPRHRKN